MGFFFLPLGLLRVACDEVVVHVEEADPQQVEDDVQSVTQSHRLVVGLPEGGEGALLWAQTSGSEYCVIVKTKGSDFILSKKKIVNVTAERKKMSSVQPLEPCIVRM